MTPGALGLLATHGYETVPVFRRPRVAILATGDEVVPPEAEPQPGQLRDSHTAFLLAAGRSLIRDTLDEIVAQEEDFFRLDDVEGAPATEEGAMER